jgi:outer membrane cobalamin receptor
VRAVGLELEGEYRPSPHWSFALSGLVEQTEVTHAPQLPDLVGRWLPQAAEEQAVLRVRWSDPDLLDVLVQGRYVGPRFEDDVNTLELGDLVVADLTVSHRLNDSISLFGAVENLFDRAYEVSHDTTGLVQVERRLAHLGARFHYR